MKMKKAILRTLIIMMVAILGVGSIIPSFASKNIEKNLSLSYFRYVNGEKQYGYALSIVGNHPVFQIMSSTNDTDYYCLNASVGDTWINGHIGENSVSEYNMEYDLDSDIEGLKSNTNEVYSNIGKSQYLKQILWILDNMYISDKKLSGEQNLARKNELLARAGLVYGAVDNYDLNDNQVGEGYKYNVQQEYDYTNAISEQGLKGYFYYDSNDQYNQVEIPDEMVSVAQQSALWYFTNYLENNSNNSQVYNVRENILELARTSDKETLNWYGMGSNNDGHPFNHTTTNVSGKEATIEKWQQEMATILCWYLIDAANNYAESDSVTIGIPLTIAPAQSEISKKTVSNTDYYVVGPIKIDEIRTAVYALNNTISVNGDTTTGAYISNIEGTKNQDQTISNYLGQNIYIAIPKSKINGNNIQITFDGTYKTNEKKLLVSTTKTEQPVVEVTPKDEPFELKVTAPIQKEFDLALRKVITKVTSADGTTKMIVNENGTNATRNVTVNPDTIPNTATYNHRKDPVVVEKGDIITYSITVYNEGEMEGYAKTIVDELPYGLVPKNPTGTYTNGNVNYSYEYYLWDGGHNRIIFTNVSKNKLKPYNGQNTISSETIEIECEVTQEPLTTTNTYLTNIAYISGAYNAETNQDVVQDRDSSTSNGGVANLNTTGEKYTGYHGGNNSNGDNSKNVYRDGTNNDDYFPGREDDDDFEIIVIKPAEFDLALQKYIESVISPDGTTKAGRNAPTINTSKLIPNGTEKTAEYKFTVEKDQRPITVKSGDYVLYNFTVYNEGEVDGYVNKITDNIPTGLEFVYAKEPQDGKTIIKCDSQGNMTETEVSEDIYASIVHYNSYWLIDQTNNVPKKDIYNGQSTISISCDVKAAKTIFIPTHVKGAFLKAYDSSKDNNYDGTGLDRLSVQVLLRVSAPNGTVDPIRNEAAITEATDKEGNVQDIEGLRDRDSQTKPIPADNITNPWPGKDGDKNYQDDEDYDNIILEKVDLALTKFIIAKGEKYPFKDNEWLTENQTAKDAGSKSNPYVRQTKVDTKPLLDGENNATYEMDKSPLSVEDGELVLYNIRVYNEGDVDVYAGEVTDYLPDGLIYVYGNEINEKYGWKVDSKGKTISTKYLSKEVNEDKILKAFDKKSAELDYQDLQVVCKVDTKAQSQKRLVNSAEITIYEDENGTPFDTDIDSQPKNLPEDKKNKEGKPDGRYNQDDEDYEVLETKIIDLALTKFITAISEDEKIENGEYLTPNQNVGSKENPYDRATKVDTTPLKEGKSNAEYIMKKESEPVSAESYILYNIRVYNEGEVDVYAGEVKDYLPEYLEFVIDDAEKFNEKYGWKLSEDKKTVTTNYLSKEVNEDKILKAFDKETDDGKGSKLAYQDLPILCRIKSNAPDKTKLINSAEITKYEDKNGNKIDEDIDSKPENLPDDKKNEEGKPEGRYNEDDEDYEVVEVKKKIVDLALTKFIVAYDGKDDSFKNAKWLTKDGTEKDAGSKTNPYNRVTEVKTDKLKNDPNCHYAEYIMVKDPLTVPAQSYVLYNIRVYNEGETDVYAGEVTDRLPEELEYVYGNAINEKYGWSVDSTGKVISTKYLSKKVNEDKLLKAFDKKTDDEHGSGLDYEDLQVVCKVSDKAQTKKDFVNFAEITEYENKDGDPIPEDIDSKPDNINEKYEDDDDYDVINIKTFDLSLLKYVTQAIKIEDGKTTTYETGNVGDEKDIPAKVEVNKKKLNSTVVKFRYTIKITNEGDVEGYAKEITDYVPDGLKFYAEDNKDIGTVWVDEGNNIISTRQLENTLLKPGESAEVYVILRWINGSSKEALSMKTNTAEISEDYNEEGLPDRDSTPDNKVPGEDDIDTADVLLSIKTGLASNIIMYVTAGTIILTVLGVGIFAIKKYVL